MSESKTETTPAQASIIPDPKNPNRMRDSDKARMVQALEEFGDLGGIIINRRTGLLVGGHQRTSVMPDADMNLADLPKPEPDGTVARGYIDHKGRRFAVRVVDWTEEKAHAAMLAANRFGRVGHDDDGLLRDLLEEIGNAVDGPDLDLTGFDREFRDGIFQTEDEAPEPAAPHDGQAAELQKKWKTAAGQIWNAGPHRILCGDSTNPENWKRLMRGEKAVLCNTDPPYGVSNDKTPRASLPGRNCQKILGDEKREDDLLRDLLVPAFRRILENTAPDAAFYFWHASATRRDFQQALDTVGIQERQYIIWTKDVFVMGHADYHHQVEPAFYCHRSGSPCRWEGDRRQSTVWRIRPPAPADLAVSLANGIRVSDGDGNLLYIAPKAPKTKKTRLLRLQPDESLTLLAPDSGDAWQISRDPNKERMHPTQKPVRLFEIPITNHTKPGDLVAEPFSGSGAQFLAAHRTGRRCFGMDQDPNSVAVTLERLSLEGLSPALEAPPPAPDKPEKPEKPATFTDTPPAQTEKKKETPKCEPKKTSPKES